MARSWFIRLLLKLTSFTRSDISTGVRGSTSRISGLIATIRMSRGRLARYSGNSAGLPA